MLSFLKGYSSGINAKYSIGKEEFRVGPWAVHDGKARSGGEPVSVFVFDKSTLLRQLPQGVRKSVATQTITDYAQRGVSQLSKLRHPSFVRLIEPLETSSKSLLFVTERLSSSLEALIQAKSNESVGSDDLNDLAIERGALVLCEGLAFLHNLGQAHTNLSPSSVLVAASGDWKISGLEFVNEFTTDFFLPSIDPRMPEYLRVDLDYLAPEVVLDHSLGAENDVWALACVLYSSYTLRRPLDCRGDPNAYKDEYTRFSRKIKTMPPLAPRLGQQTMVQMFERDSSQRQTLDSFVQTDYFNHSLVKALQFLDSFETKSESDKSEFLNYLEEILPQFPKPILRRKILAFVVKELGGPTGEANCTYQMSKILLAVSASLSQLTFAEEIIPLFKSLQKNTDFHNALADNIGIVVGNTTEKTFGKEVLPILQGVLKNESSAQRSLLANSATFVPHLTLSSMEQKLFPPVLALFGTTQAKSVKVACIGSFSVMIQNKLSSLLINEQLLPALRNMKTRDPAVVVAVKDLYSHVSESLSSADVMEKVLPHMAEISLGRDLSVSQFKAILDSMRAQIAQFEKDQVRVLQGNKEVKDTFNKKEISTSAASQPAFLNSYKPEAKSEVKEKPDLFDFDTPQVTAQYAPMSATPKVPMAPLMAAPKSQVQARAQVQSQVQTQVQTQVQPQTQAQPQSQPQAHSHPQPQSQPYSSPFLVTSLQAKPGPSTPSLTPLQPTKRTESLL